MVLIELGECAFKREFTARDLQALHEIAGAHEQHAPSVLEQCESMAAARARSTRAKSAL